MKTAKLVEELNRGTRDMSEDERKRVLDMCEEGLAKAKEDLDKKRAIEKAREEDYVRLLAPTTSPPMKMTATTTAMLPSTTTAQTTSQNTSPPKKKTAMITALLPSTTVGYKTTGGSMMVSACTFWFLFAR